MEKTHTAQTKTHGASVPNNIRYRTIGLKAIKSLIKSSSFNTDGVKHLRVILPVVLENLYSERPAYIGQIQRRENANEAYEKDMRSRLRQSESHSRMSLSVERPLEADPSSAAGTTADVDQRANEEVAVLAMQSLREIFSSNNPGQARSATTLILNFIAARQATASKTTSGKTWSVDLFEAICLWTPVQDRFIILVTTMESLIRSPIVENDMNNQLELVGIIGWLLKSNINFIGLSVMDILIGLIQHILSLLQLGASGSGIKPHRQQATGSTYNFSTSSLPNAINAEVVRSPSAPRLQLLSELQRCVGSLATHVYYSDQIGDMVSALLLRLKPSSASAIPTAAAAVQNPGAAAEAIADSAHLENKPQADGFFSFDTARVLALQAVKDIIVTANSRLDGPEANGRNRVDVAAWEGTQWLLRDPDARVRVAYVDALLTWLALEVDRTNLRVIDDHVRSSRKPRENMLNGGSIAKRASSNASRTSRLQPTKARSSFLELLHLAIYENALQHAESREADILLLHLLLTTLVQKLGVNSICHGLPMILRLQDDVNKLSTAYGRVVLSSLVYGYLWAVIETFKLATSQVGAEIRREMHLGADAGVWLQSIRVPALSINQINTHVETGPANRNIFDHAFLQHGIRPFESRQLLVEEIADEYQSSVRSPPVSPQPTPVRPSAQTTRSTSLPTITTTSAPNPTVPILPDHVREQMLASWSAEACLASIDNHSLSRPLSLNTHGTNNTNNLVTANGSSPTTSNSNSKRRGTGSPSGAAAANVYQNRFESTPAARHLSSRQRADQHLTAPTNSNGQGSGLSSKRSLVRVDQLKRALDGRTASVISLGSTSPQNFPVATYAVSRSPIEYQPRASRGDPADDTASESMISASFRGSIDEDEYGEGTSRGLAGSSGHGDARMSSIGSESQYQYQPRYEPLRQQQQQQQQRHGAEAGTGTHDFAATLYGESTSTSLGVPVTGEQGRWARGGSVGSAISGLSAANGGKVDLATLLDEIEVGDDEGGMQGTALGRGGSVRGGRPPY